MPRIGMVLLAGLSAGIAGSLVTSQLVVATFPASVAGGGPAWISLIACASIAACTGMVGLLQPLRLARTLHRHGLHLDQFDN
jgi:hypothetical protein